MGQRILVLSAAVGAGHLRAAEAIELALRQLDPTAHVENIDVLTLTNAAFRRVYGKAYLDLVNSAPHLLGYLYDRLDRAPRFKTGDRMRLAMQQLNAQDFLDKLRDEPWDLAINTHFLPAELIAAATRKRRLRMPQLTVTTDFEAHRLWVNEPCAHYFAATAESAAYLQHLGIEAARTSVTGIPIHPAFTRLPNRAEALRRQGLAGDRPIVLQSAGGFGVGPIAAITESLLATTTPIELVVVCGKNEDAKAQLEKIAVPAHHRIKLIGYTREMHELMAVADLVVSKPGGLTTSEVLASGAAMVIVNPIPGQESRNSDYLLEAGAAIKVNNLPTLTMKVDAVLADPRRLAELKRHARRIARPDAAFEIARRALAWPTAA
jgi:processive 1,2-diacylglycerol beta-glucosyltransferase